MDAATLQARIYSGYAKAAQRLGYPYDVYRPNGIDAPLAMGNKVKTGLPATFTSATTQEFNFSRSVGRDTINFHVLADMTEVRVGDYFVNDTWGTFFLNQLMPALPPRAVRCTQKIEVHRQAAPSGFGVQPFGGNTAATETKVMSGGWPAAIISGARGEYSDVDLPGDLRLAGYYISLPAIPGVLIKPTDIVVDDLGRRFITSVAELTTYGWYLTAREAVT